MLSQPSWMKTAAMSAGLNDGDIAGQSKVRLAERGDKRGDIVTRDSVLRMQFDCKRRIGADALCGLRQLAGSVINRFRRIPSGERKAICRLRR